MMSKVQSAFSVEVHSLLQQDGYLLKFIQVGNKSDIEQSTDDRQVKA